MFSVYDVQTREITSNMTVDKVADFLIAKGALSERETHSDDGLLFENKEWLDFYVIKYSGSDDVQKAYNDLRTAIK